MEQETMTDFLKELDHLENGIGDEYVKNRDFARALRHLYVGNCLKGRAAQDRSKFYIKTIFWLIGGIFGALLSILGVVITLAVVI